MENPVWDKELYVVYDSNKGWQEAQPNNQLSLAQRVFNSLCFWKGTPPSVHICTKMQKGCVVEMSTEYRHVNSAIEKKLPFDLIEQKTGLTYSRFCDALSRFSTLLLASTDAIKV